MKKILCLVLAGGMFLSIMGCSTVKGLGEDVATVGHWMTKGSDNVKEGGAK